MYISKKKYDQMCEMLNDSTKLIMEYQKKCRVLSNRIYFLEQCINKNVDISFPNTDERGFNSANTGSDTVSQNLDY